MNHLDNPYSPGAGTPPPELAGRAAVIDGALAALQRIKAGRSAQGQILVGLRGVGKTVLLSRIADMAEDEDYLTIRIEAHEGKTLPELLVPPLRERLFTLSQTERARVLASRALRVLKGFVASLKVTIGELTVGLGIDPELGVADSGDLEADLARLLEVVGEAAREAGRPILLLIDEIQYLSAQEFSALIMGLHRANQRQLPVLLIAAGLPQTLALAGNSKSHAERLFRYPEVGALSHADARSAILGPARKLGVTFTGQAVEDLLAVTQRYPYFIQQWAYEAWNEAAAPVIGPEDIRRATARAIEELDLSFFKVRFDRCTPAERRYMRALAGLGAGRHRSSDVAEALGVKVTSQGPVRNALIRKGMVYAPAHGDIAFTVPLFDEFLKRAMPQ